MRTLCGHGLCVFLVALCSIGLMSFADGALAQTSTATLLWTAPGDDGNIGTATAYDLRFRSTPIVGGDTLTWWNSASQVSGLPRPSAAGATDSVVVQGLDPSLTYYFIVRAVDEASNWSGFSNVAVKSPAPDTTPPAAITDLAASTPPAQIAPTTEALPGNPPKPKR